MQPPSPPPQRSRARPVFPRDSKPGFYEEVRRRAQPVIEANEGRARWLTWLQVTLIPAALVATYFLLLTRGNDPLWFYGTYAAFGAVVTVMALNIVHDASHRCLFASSRVNRFWAHAMDIAGANSFIWGRRHVQMHHTYTNIPGWDVDLADRTVVRLSPTDELRPMHRYQHLYLPFLYPLYTLNWIFLRDFRDCFSRQSLVGRTIRVPLAEKIKTVACKVSYLGYIIGVPALVLTRPWYDFLLGFLLLQGVSALITLLVVLPTHFDEDAPFPEPGDDLRMKEEWAIHQLRTTNDYSTSRPVVTFLLGGLNHHVAHHLFPSVNHNALPPLTRLVETVAQEYGLPYKSFTFVEAMRSHFRLLRKNGMSLAGVFDE
jgi:linoleoyl-CoA desaturase